MKAISPTLFLACLCSLQLAAEPATWRAVSIDIKERQQSSESQTAGSIDQVSYNSNNQRFTIPFAKPTDRFPLGSGQLSLFKHPQPATDTASTPAAQGIAATTDASPADAAPSLPAQTATEVAADTATAPQPPVPPTLLAQIQLPASKGDTLLLLWPSAEASSPYRLLPIADQRPQPDKRILRLINCTPQPLYALVEGKPHEVLPLQPIAVECDAEGRSRVELYRPPQADAPARRISSSSYRVTRGEMLTALLLPAPGAQAPRLHIFRD